MRVTFEEAISEPQLLKTEFEKLSLPQQVILKAFYGLPLEGRELEAWSIFQGGAEFDVLGYPTTISPVAYVPQEYEEMWGILGRRSGKSDKVLSFAMAYEAAMGGHEEYISRRQRCWSFIVGQNLTEAEKTLQESILGVLEASPLMAKMITKANSEGIHLKNRHSIIPAPPHIKVFRGKPIPVVGFDEVAFWYKSEDAANPDYEVERAVSPAMAQFPFRKRLGFSTPWSEEGILFEANNAGTNGRKLDSEAEERLRWSNVLVVHAPTPAVENPRLERKWFAKEYQKDPEAYEREILGKFVEGVGTAFPSALLQRAVIGAPASREPKSGFYYVGAMDPAFRRDKFAFTIVHYEPDVGLVQDVVREWRAPSPNLPINPLDPLSEIGEILRAYNLSFVYSDQYQLESLQQLALSLGFSIIGRDFTSRSKAKMYGSFLGLLKQDKVKLLKNEGQIAELRSIERRLLPAGHVHFSAPVGKHDDLASALVLASSGIVYVDPSLRYAKDAKEETTFQKCFKQVKRMQEERAALMEGDQDWT